MRPIHPLLLAAAVLAALAGCSSHSNDLNEAPLTVKILHVNDHHSRLDAETVNLNVTTASGAKESVVFDLGGFPRVAAAIQALAATSPNVLKLHAGDAITGDLYYTITNGKADADLMNTVCFDALALGNHEFDSGDAGLKTFLDFLRPAAGAGGCNTPVLSANTRPSLGVSALTRTSATDYFRPSTIVERSGAKIGIVGITVAGKTKNSSRPDATTVFEDEVTAAQREIDALRSQGVSRIVLLTHQGYEQDVAMAPRLTGVDVIVGGDSHTLVGPSTLTGYGITPAGRYPTMASDAAGRNVCIVQAWQYSWVVGELDVSFNSAGDVVSCSGGPRVLIGNALRRATGSVALSAADQAAIAADVAREPSLRVQSPSATAGTVLAAYKTQKDAFGATKVGTSADNLCLRRVPGTKRDTTRSALGDTCNKAAFTNAHGGDAQQLVAFAYLEQGKRFGGADIALQNAGGVRIDIRQGDVTIGTVYTLLPFKNVLARLTMTGAEVKATLEDAITFVLASAGNSGAYPYGANIRWTVDLNQPAGSRFSAIEVKSASGTWTPINPSASYKVMVNDFLVAGGDGWNTLKTITGARREDQLFLDYADSFVNYTKSVQTLAKLPESEYSTQVFVDTP
ncbi:MAG: 5'-nucleotidase C-terminal domain-containing protein [Betaproteobacteria bacterium]|nr:5'-nucleotidase C-terminal domain-containing protein [Betaproteobacteria bacterium]